jgi:hypothetical protein
MILFDPFPADSILSRIWFRNHAGVRFMEGRVEVYPGVLLAKEYADA